MTAQTSPLAGARTSQRTDVASFVVFAAVVANAVTQFLIQAWMTFRFATDVWRIPEPLCAALIVALDLFAVVFMVFTYLLRSARLRTKAYVWTIFALGIGAQLFAAELYGDHKDWTNPVRIFAALPSVFLAASLHGLIIWRRHRAEPKVEPTATPATIERKAEQVAQTRQAEANLAAAKTRIVTPDPKPSPVPAAPVKTRRRGAGRKNGVSDEVKASTVARVQAGEVTPAQAAHTLGVSTRAVQIWVKDAGPARAHQREAEQVLAEFEADLTANEQVNGHKPEGVTA